MYLAVGARVLLWSNVCNSVGLVNGATGIIKDFLYGEDSNPPALPHSVVIDFSDYSGPPFFSCQEKATWVPIRADKESWTSYDKNIKGSVHYRKQFPIGLAWGWTFWKLQGSTLKTPIVLKLGDSEKVHGLSYVGFSRATLVSNICILNGCSLQRLTDDISKLKSIKDRKIEDRRLDCLCDETMIIFRR
jgi:hypothetical protein